MKQNDLVLETASGVCTRSLVTAILESRRAYQLAMQLARQVLLTGPGMQGLWEETAPAPADVNVGRDTREARASTPPRHADLRFTMRRRTPRHGLRLVLPNHFDSPLVMPADTPYTSAGEPTHERPDD